MMNIQIIVNRWIVAFIINDKLLIKRVSNKEVYIDNEFQYAYKIVYEDCRKRQSIVHIFSKNLNTAIAKGLAQVILKEGQWDWRAVEAIERFQLNNENFEYKSTSACD